jgi:hypothetical protein
VIFAHADPGDPIDHGDIVAECPLTFMRQCSLDDLVASPIECVPTRVLLLTQACDLANRNASNFAVAVLDNVQQLVDEGLLNSAHVRGPIRAGRVYGWYFLPKSATHPLSEMVPGGVGGCVRATP